ncbi:DUF502 domain-containing protein [Halobacteriaceae archaeon SHR40]|uniref:DUF502 domain-containing protein n=1 Tax=Halovenus amylolytica TaxID=2500550 RepID=UPI000FE3E37D
MSSWEGVRNSFIAGLVLITPLVITLYILQVLFGFALNFIDPIVAETDLASYTANVEAVARVLAAVLIVLVVSFLGFLAQHPSGQRLFGSLGRTVAVIPIFRTIYSTIRQMSTSLSSGETSYDSLVLVEFPREDFYSIGLDTSESPQAVADVAGEPVRNIFLPSSPNPAGGRLVLVPESQVHDVDMSVRQGMGLIMTTGAGSRDVETVPPVSDMSPEEAIASLEELEAETQLVGTPGTNPDGATETDSESEAEADTELESETEDETETDDPAEQK